MALWVETRRHPTAAPFSGGLLDSWPAYAVDVLAIGRIEYERIIEFLKMERGG